MTLEDKVHATRLLALRRAEELGNVSAACRELGISRCLFYRWRNRYREYGRDGLHPKRYAGRRGRPHGLSVQDERAILVLALSDPTCGPGFYALQLAQQQRPLSPSTIYRALRRVGLGTRHERLLLLERHSAERSGLLTERTRRQLPRARLSRHVLPRSPPGRREGLADYGVRCGLFLRRGPYHPHLHRCRSTRPPDGRSSDFSRTEAVNSRAVSMRCVTISGSNTRAPSRATPDQRLRRAPAEHDPSPALARRLPPQVFHHRAATGRVPAAVP